ncbi:MAG: hypothetical protein KAH06_06875 [Desulfobacterales bacterium]|nr:hypothetical protein [Desulfobacterales bacterium]
MHRKMILLAIFLIMSCGHVSSLFSAYPADPLSDLNWSSGTSGVADIKTAFDTARQHENSELGTFVPEIILPAQALWDSFSDGEKALWLINAERQDRSLMLLNGLEENVREVAQYYADFLLNNDAWGHYEDDRSPWERLSDNPAIGACHDFLGVAENLAVLVSTGNIPLSIERSIYMWMYDDAGSSWGHRHAILWYPYNDNSGVVGMEGFLGIGRASGGPYQGPFDSSWPKAEIIVMNIFDPCASWNGGVIYVSGEVGCSSHLPCYHTIGNAYQHPKSYQEIRVVAGFYIENLSFEKLIEVILSGGWNNAFNDNTNGQSTIVGALTITGGTVIVDRIVIADTAFLTRTEELPFNCWLPKYWSRLASLN